MGQLIILLHNNFWPRRAIMPERSDWRLLAAVDHRVCRRYLTCVHGNRSLSVVDQIADLGAAPPAQLAPEPQPASDRW